MGTAPLTGLLIEHYHRQVNELERRVAIGLKNLNQPPSGSPIARDHHDTDHQIRQGMKLPIPLSRTNSCNPLLSFQRSTSREVPGRAHSNPSLVYIVLQKPMPKLGQKDIHVHPKITRAHRGQNG
ncbi:hypothetical protein LOK49_LG09G01740 [Camellia lanceoleosa]|uniref:Uncharacterized protein n=1 Tax=Camellia lanceoleosa TaxID=1840588 RepID=A0ACC0GIL9_9ERIC|nr:hypothetical protein LOK49_LG09G01740 [Camellia lanceoleosa]